MGEAASESGEEEGTECARYLHYAQRVAPRQYLSVEGTKSPRSLDQ